MTADPTAHPSAKASGDVSAFVLHADPGRVFAKVELPALMDNPAVTSINGLTKSWFSDWFTRFR